MKIRVAVDAMGGDRAPEEIVAGALAAASDSVEPVLFGRQEVIEPLAEGLEIVHADDIVAMDEKPADAAREKRESSMFAACRAVGEGDAQAVVSAEKGNRLVRETHPVLEASQLDFVGNVESRELLGHAADVVVCDGFTGNMALKLMEGTIKTLLDEFRKEIEASPRGKLGGLLIRPAARGLRKRLDPDTYGGAYLLVLRGLVVIAHGSSSRTAIANAIGLGAQGAAGNVVERVAARLEEEVAAAPG